MNTATQNLENDHVHILRLIDVMEAMVNKKSNTIDHIELVINVIRMFADGLHHAKEENLLFPMMGKKGFSSEQGPVAVMLNEHVQGRIYVKGISDGIIELKKGNTVSLQRIYENMSGYANLLRNHIAKENNVLFRMADQVLSADEQQNLLSEFAKAEKIADPEYNSENSVAKINNLAAFYLQ